MTFQTSHVSDRCHVPNLYGFIRFITSCHKYTIANSFSIWVSVHGLHAFDHTRVSLNIADKLHGIYIPYFQVFQRCRIKHVAYRCDIIDLLIMGLINHQLHSPIVHNLGWILIAGCWLHIRSHILRGIQDITNFHVCIISIVVTSV